MVIRVLDRTPEDLLIARQGAMAGDTVGALPIVVDAPCILSEPAAWNGGLWQPSVRAITLNLYNAGSMGAQVTVEVDAPWVKPYQGRPLMLPGYSGPVPLTLDLDPQGLSSGALAGRVALHSQPGEASLVVSLRLHLPDGPIPWWEAESLHFETEIQQHKVLLHSATGGDRVETQLFFMDQRLPTPRPRLSRNSVDWELQLWSGVYRCDLQTDGQRRPLSVNPPHRWRWSPSGHGDLAVGIAACKTRLWNVGNRPLEAQVDTSLRWLECDPATLSLPPGQSLELTLNDNLEFAQERVAEGALQLLALPERTVCSTIGVQRGLRANTAVPVISPDAVRLKIYSERGAEEFLEVTNYGDQPLILDLQPEGGIEVTMVGGLQPIPPLQKARIRLFAGVTTATEGVQLHINTNSDYPALQSILIPVTVERVLLLVTPDPVDFGTVRFGTSPERWLKVVRSDGVTGSYEVKPKELQPWLAVRGLYLKVSNQRLVAAQRKIAGSVSTTIIIKDKFTSAEKEVPVTATFNHPCLGCDPRLYLGVIRPGRVRRGVINYWDEGQDLAVRGVETANRHLRVNATRNGVAVELRSPETPGPFKAEVAVYSNDPDRPRVTVTVRADIRPNWWDQTVAWFRLYGWDLGMGALICLVLIVMGGVLWWSLRPAQSTRRPVPLPLHKAEIVPEPKGGQNRVYAVEAAE